MTNDIPMKEKFEELKKVLENIKKDEKILIIGDTDPDGIVGSFVFAKLLQKYGFEYNKDFDVKFVDHDFRNVIKTNLDLQNQILQYNYLFFIDVPLEDSSIFKNNFVCSMDHHKSKPNINLLINPMYSDEMKDKPNCSSSALAYCAYRCCFGDNNLLRKIAFSGAVSDWFAIGSLPYLNISINNEEYFINGGQIVPTISALLQIYSNLNTEKYNSQWVFERLLFEVKTDLKAVVILPEDFYKEQEKYRKKAAKRIKAIFDSVQVRNNIVILELKQKDKEFKTIINHYLNVIYSSPTTFVFFENKQEKQYQASCRSEIYDLVKLIDFLKTEIKDLRGGGHPVAAGFFVKKKEFKKCKKLIIENIEKFRK